MFGFFLKSKFEKFLFFLMIVLISFLIFFFFSWGNFFMLLRSILLIESLEIISILLNEICLLPLKGNVFFRLTSSIDDLP